MSATYEYPNKTISPNLTGIHTGVVSSAMTDKNIDYCRWDGEIEMLKVVWGNALDAGDKTILDGIVISNS